MPGLRRRAALAAALAALAAGIAGCGGAGAGNDAADRYVGEVNHAQDRFAQTVKRLSGRVTQSSTAREDRRTLESFTAAVDSVVTELRRIHPPQSVAALHAELVDDIDTYGGAVEAAATALTSHDAARLEAARRRLNRATTTVGRRIDHTIGAINDALSKG